MPVPSGSSAPRGATGLTPTGIAYDRAGPAGDLPIVLLHAGVADRRMWDPQWASLTEDRDVLRLDLRGFGESVARPVGALAPREDVAATLDALGIECCHLVGASFGAGVAVEVALAHPTQVRSMLLAAPGGSLIPEMTADLRAFADAEGTALAAEDLDAAVEANVRWWVDGPGRGPDAVDAATRDAVRRMQRRAFELTLDWDDVEEDELDPPALDRLAEVPAPTVVLVGGHDLEAIHRAADRLAEGLPDVRRVDWADAAHLPSLERPVEFTALLRDWLP